MTKILSEKIILVTGGARFIGSNLCEELLYLGIKAVCLDNFALSKLENISYLFENNNFTLVEGGIRNLRRLLKGHKWVSRRII